MPLSVLLLGAVGAGVSAGVFGDPRLIEYAQWVMAAAAGVAVAGTGGRSRRVAGVASIAALTALSAVLGAGALDRAMHPDLRTLLEDRVGGFSIEGAVEIRPEAPILVEGRLRTDATMTESGATLDLDVEHVWLGTAAETAPGGASITVVGALAGSAAGTWRAGRVIRAPALLRRPARYLNAGVPNQERALARRGVTLVGSVKSAALVEVVRRGSWVEEAAASVRARVRATAVRYISVHGAQSGAIATAILIGDRTGLDEDVQRRLQEAGTYHVIAISGGNIALLVALVLAALWSCGVRGAWAAGGTLGAVVVYSLVVSGGPSVTRATVMAALYLLLRVIDQRTSPIHALALTGAALLLAQPLAIADVGFWLTFLATTAIVLGLPRLHGAIGPWADIPLLLVKTSLCAEVVLMPIGALVFERVTVAGLVLNLIAVPCMSIVEVGALATVAADAVGAASLAHLGGWVTHLAVRGLTESAALVDMAPWCTWRVPPPSATAVTVYYGALLAWWWTSRPPVDTGRRRAAVRASAGALVGLFVWIASAPSSLVRIEGDGRLHVTAFDVGQGDAFMVQFPNGRRLMVDAGGVSTAGGFDIGDRVVGPALRALGVRELDYLAFTHGDPDHIGGAPALVRQFSPSEVWEGVPVPHHEPSQMLHGVAASARVAWRTLQRGDRMEMGGVELRVHHPPPPDWERQKVRNDDSLVIELRFGRVSVLLTGDIGRDVERQISPTLGLLPLVVLKAPHHGSGTSSSAEFIDAIQPALVVISCGRANPYGHPVPGVLARYRAVGAEVFRTDQDGQIELVTDGETVRASSFTGRHETITR